VLPETCYAILSSFANIDVKAERIRKYLEENPYYSFQFLKVIESLKKREQMPSLEGALVLFGMQNSRDLILAMQMNRVIKGGHPEWEKTERSRSLPRNAEVCPENRGTFVS